jgi:flagellar motor protein MotB
MFRRDREEVSFWPALADFVLAILLLVLLLWIADTGMRAVWDVSNPRLKRDQIAISKADWDALSKDQKAAMEDLQRRIKLAPDEQVVKVSELERLKAMVANRIELKLGERVIKAADLAKLIELKPGEQVAMIAEIRELEKLREEIKRRPDKPLVFPLEEASGFAFESGKAELSSAFVANLREVIIPKVQGIVREFNIEVMEVFGHTDGQPVSRQSNFDNKLNGLVLNPSADVAIQRLKPGSNADLGLARALAVTSFLQSEFARSGDAKLSALACRAYSGAQIISPVTNTIVGANNEDDPTRRRIELRFTRNPKRGP